VGVVAQQERDGKDARLGNVVAEQDGRADDQVESLFRTPSSSARRALLAERGLDLVVAEDLLDPVATPVRGGTSEAIMAASRRRSSRVIFVTGLEDTVKYLACRSPRHFFISDE
jgi:hypothetical protein